MLQGVERILDGEFFSGGYAAEGLNSHDGAAFSAFNAVGVGGVVDESSEGCAYIVFVGFAYFYVAYTEGCVSGYTLCGEESEAIDGRGLYGKALRQGFVHLGDGSRVVVVGAFFYG